MNDLANEAVLLLKGIAIGVWVLVLIELFRGLD